MKFPAGIKVFGDTSYRGECLYEADEQKTIIAEIRHRWPRGIGQLVIHPRNEGRRNRRQYQKEYLEGLTAGAPDIIIPGAPTFCLELKRKDHTKSALSVPEREYLIEASRSGCFVAIALGWEAGIDAVQEWTCTQRRARSALTFFICAALAASMSSVSAVIASVSVSST